MLNKLSKDVIILIFQFACSDFKELISFGCCNTLMRNASLHRNCFKYMQKKINLHDMLENNMKKIVEKINKTRKIESIFYRIPKRRKTATKLSNAYNNLVDEYNRKMSERVVNLVDCVVKFKGIECITLGSCTLAANARTSEFFMDSVFHYLQPEVLKKISEKLQHSNIKKLVLCNLTTSQIDEIKIPSSVFSLAIKSPNYVRTLPSLFFNNENLKEVSISSNKYARDLFKNIGRDLKNLEKFKINCAGVSPITLKNITKCKKIKELTAYNIGKDVVLINQEEFDAVPELMDGIFAMPSLLKVDVSNCEWLVSRDEWSIPEKITHLNISNGEFFGGCLDEMLKSNTNLVELNLCGNDETVFRNRDYCKLALFTSLTCLNISNTGINDDALTRISVGLNDLKIIYVYNCQMIRGPGIFAISINSKKLEYIDINLTQIPPYYVKLFKKNNNAIIACETIID